MPDVWENELKMDKEFQMAYLFVLSTGDYDDRHVLAVLGQDDWQAALGVPEHWKQFK